MDNLSREKRSKVMASIRGKNTTPELMIRKLLWSAGKRYRIHDRSIFGTPDISLKRKKLAVFIDGCFWHGCEECYKTPTTNPSYWIAKRFANKHRRNAVVTILKRNQWTCLEFWEHEVVKEPSKVVSTLLDYW